MFNKLPPLVGVPLRYGLIAGVIGCIFLTILFYIGNHPLLIFPFFDPRLVLFIIFTFFVLKELREYYFGGILFFWQGMIACFVLTFTFATIASLFLLLFSSLETDFITQYVALFIERAQANYTEKEIEQIGKEVYEQSLRDLPLSATPLRLGISYFFGTHAISFFISIIISVVLRRQPKPL
ncbi:MAG: hypothetical protein DI538_01635 [Azospira oryzae]|jgi:hypothetical protein|nr:MAG: hypothetical protein DI538_01635 [Azospira oryzae]